MKSDQRRAAIVAESIRLFAEKGFRGTTTRELAAALGVTEPVLYQHFKTKRDLYTAIIETKAHAGVEKTARLAECLRGNDDVALFGEVAGLILDHYAEDPAYSRLLLYSALEGHELARLFFDEQIVQFFNELARYIRRRIRAGAFRRVDPQLAARSFVGMVNYHGELQLLFGAGMKISRNKRIAQIVEFFLDGLRVEGRNV